MPPFRPPAIPPPPSARRASPDGRAESICAESIRSLRAVKPLVAAEVRIHPLRVSTTSGLGVLSVAFGRLGGWQRIGMQWLSAAGDKVVQRAVPVWSRVVRPGFCVAPDDRREVFECGPA